MLPDSAAAKLLAAASETALAAKRSAAVAAPSAASSASQGKPGKRRGSSCSSSCRESGSSDSDWEKEKKLKQKTKKKMKKARKQVEKAKKKIEKAQRKLLRVHLSPEDKEAAKALASSTQQLHDSAQESQAQLRSFILEAKRNSEAKKEAEWQERRANKLEHWSSGQAGGLQIDPEEWQGRRAAWKGRWSSGKLRNSAKEADEGYYEASTGEILAGQLAIQEKIGEGVFSSVYRAKLIAGALPQAGQLAVKFVRNVDMIRQASAREMRLLEWLAQKRSQDDEGMRYLMGLATAGSFEHRGHLCLCFDLMLCDMRAALGKYGKPGLPLPALQKYGKQLFLGLSVLTRLGVVHADLKPDNLLLSLDREEVRIADFGSAMRVGKVSDSGHVAPRFYRAPEVILGCKYDTSVDVWAAGCTLFELATGFHLFSGSTPGLVLKDQLEVTASCTERLRSTSTTWASLFGSEGEVSEEAASLKVAARPLHSELDRLLGKPSAGSDTDLRAQFCDLLQQLLKMDPVERHRADKALTHPFWTFLCWTSAESTLGATDPTALGDEASAPAPEALTLSGASLDAQPAPPPSAVSFSWSKPAARPACKIAEVATSLTDTSEKVNDKASKKRHETKKHETKKQKKKKQKKKEKKRKKKSSSSSSST
eukprot:TRINITY_DN93342_c0_g1_i1.p1 TRINITY_DN93342_c0_g1~~TRINITY_DN93342_c0_g1_i1.p1  ORF type:complete len:652 (-),score=152.49 TRINITY_DN93342_c0_g1_i1:22-1977(-)